MNANASLRAHEMIGFMSMKLPGFFFQNCLFFLNVELLWVQHGFISEIEDYYY